MNTRKLLVSVLMFVSVLLSACAPAAMPPAPTATLTALPTQTASPTIPLIFPEIAFVTNRDGNHEIYVMNADGSSQTNLSQNAAYDTNPVWSPDGTQIAFNSFRDGYLELYVMNTDGSNQTQLTSGKKGINTTPCAWSPDGKLIVFSTNQFGENGGIYVMNADGSGLLTRITALAGRPAWSPDGKQIAIESYRDDLFNYKNEIYVMNADGSDPTNLTNNIADDNHPAWSPDGELIAFDSERDGDKDIYVMNADGSGQTNLTQTPGYDFWPTWQPK